MSEPCINDDADHRKALGDIERLWGAAQGTTDGDRLDMLAAAIFAYEEGRWSISTR